MPKMIFHYAGVLSEEENSAEKIRPKKLIKAFENIGYEPTLITGTLKERRNLLSQIQNQITDYDFIYSESRTLPLRLSGSRHFPLYLDNPDFFLFKLAGTKKIPVGVFYRDIYWKYPSFIKEVGIFKYLGALYFYKEELNFYFNYTDTIFTPSERFAEVLYKIRPHNYIPLPPGADILSIPEAFSEKTINAVYVGSISPPIYDISNLLAAVRHLPKEKFSLTVVTRKESFSKYKNYYTFPENVTIQHLNNAELKQILPYFNIAVIFFVPTPYRAICFPVKLSEAIGSGLPVVSYGDNAVSDFINKFDIGWIVDNQKSDIFQYLIQHPNEIEEKRQNVLKIRHNHTWEKRAEKVAEVLSRSYEYYS